MTTQYSVKMVITGAAQNALKSINQVSGSLKTMGRVAQAASFAVNLGKVASSAKDVGKELVGLAGKAALVAGVGGVFFKNEFLDTAIAFEKLNTQMNQLYGTAQKGQAAMKWAADFAARTPLNLQEVTEAMARMKGMGLDPMNGSLQAVVDQTSKMGQGSEELMGIITALGQAYQKGKLQAEEMMQLNERLVPAWNLLSHATGKSVAVLQDASKQGRLTQKAVQVLIAQMGKESKGGALKMMQTFAGRLSNVQDHWTRFKLMVMSSGTFEFLNRQLAKVLDHLDAMAANGSLDRFANDLGGKLTKFFKVLVGVGREVWPVLKQVWSAISQVAKAVGGWGNVMKILLAIMGLSLIGKLLKLAGAIIMLIPGMGALSFAVKAVTLVLGGLFFALSIFETGKTLIGVFKLAKGIFDIWRAGGMAGLAMAALSNPITWVIAGVATLAAGAFLLISNWGKISGWFTGMWEKYGALIKDIFPPLRWVMDAADWLKKKWEPVMQWFDKVWRTLSLVIRTTFAEVKFNIKKAAFEANKNDRNVFTGEVYHHASSGAMTVKKPATRAAVPLKAQAGQQKDKLAINLHIDSEGRPRVKEFDYKGGKSVDFRASMGIMTPAFS